MKKEVYSWHPKFNVYHLPQDNLLLVSENEELFFAQERYPLFHHLDGKVDVNTILSKAVNPVQGSTFLYLVNQLLRNGMLVNLGASQIHNYLPTEQGNVRKLSFSGGKLSILSSISEPVVQTLLNICTTLTLTTRHLHLILVDDFIECQISSLISEQSGVIVLLKLSGDNISLSPVFNKATAAQLKAFQHRLLINKPVRRLLTQIFPKRSHTPPLISKPFQQEFWPSLSLHLEQHINELCSDMLTLSHDLSFQRHAYQIDSAMPDELYFSQQINQPVSLNSCPVVFNQDGGSRHVSPAETLAKLTGLVSPVTGVFGSLTELTCAQENQVKIFRGSFFKTPPLKDIDNISNSSFVQTSLGKGINPIQSQVSALCEALERYAALYQGNEPLILSKQSALTKPSYAPEQLTPYSQTQYLNFADKKHPDSNLKQSVILYQDSEIHWLPTWSLTREQQVYVPLASCFANIPFTDDQFGRWHSNGCAAGNTLEEAILQGVFELIERDATAIWWYNQVRAAVFDLQAIPADSLKKIQNTLSDSHHFWVLDITTDIGVPVMIAIGQDVKTKGYSLGLGCHLQPELAAQRALTELCQLIPIRDQNGAPFDFNAIAEGEYLHPDKTRQGVAPFTTSCGDIKGDIENIVARLQSLDYETLVVNYSRAHLPIKTAKVFVPGLCHIWPQLDNKRLYELPVKLGWQKKAKTETTINQQALYI